MRFVNSIRASYGALRLLSWLSGFLNLFCRRFDRGKNRTARAGVTLPSGLLNGQDLPPLSQLPYGAWRMGCNGCEVIAVYNALLALGRPEPLHAVAAELEEKGLLFNGFGGTNLPAVAAFFRRRGIGLTLLRRRDRRSYDAAFAAADCAVLSYWTGPKLRRADRHWNTLHTVSLHPHPAGVSVCNVYGDSARPMIVSSVEQFLTRQNAVPVLLLALKRGGETGRV